MRLLPVVALALLLGCGGAPPAPPSPASGSGSGSMAGSGSEATGSGSASGSIFALRIRATMSAPDAPKQAPLESTVYFSERHAFDHDGPGSTPSVVFDVLAGAWREPRTQRWISLAEARKVALDSRNATRAKLAKTPNDPFRALTTSLLDAKLALRRDGAILELKDANIRIEARVRIDVAPDRMVRILAWDQLNAYRRAGIRKIPPFVNLQLNRELGKARQLMSRVQIELRAPRGWQQATTEFRIAEPRGRERALALKTAASLPAADAK